MTFQAGIGCKYPLFCDIVAPLLGVLFLSLIGWFVISLLINYRKTHQANKPSPKKSEKTRQKR